MNNRDLLKYLKINNFTPSKKMGQNFLICNNYKSLIIKSSEIDKNDNIIEIGPGFGALTEQIIKLTNNLIIIELDKRINDFLSNNFPNIKIINDNFLNVNLDNLCIKNHKNKIISNLPYSISSKAIIKILKSKYIDESIIMIQKEVAKRIVSRENSKNYNNFSVFVQMLCLPIILFDVPNTVFYPKPIITSSVIKLNHFKNLDFDIIKMEKFIRNCFFHKRKTIFNNLKNFYDPKKINDSFEKISISSNIRPENISVDKYKKLFILLA